MPANHASIEAARTAKAAVQLAFGNTEGVVGVGLTRKDSGYAVKVNLHGPGCANIPKQMGGVPVVVEVVGAIQALPPQRPAAGGLAAPRGPKRPGTKR